MPIYDLTCDECGKRDRDAFVVPGKPLPQCCGREMRRLPTHQAYVFMDGLGGYPSRRKRHFGSAPYTGRDWYQTDPKEEKSEKVLDLEADARRRRESEKESQSIGV